MASLPLRPEEANEDPGSFARELIDAAAVASRSHPHAARVGNAPHHDPVRVDAVHFFALLHAERPSAATTATTAVVDPWIVQFAAQFEDDRIWLARLAVTAGAPRRIDLSRHEFLVRAQRDAMLTLVRSDRAGCALGAIAAFACDWPVVRTTLSGDAERERDPTIDTVVAAAAQSAASRRAIGFGVAQMLAVHRTLWDLLEARQAASLP